MITVTQLREYDTAKLYTRADESTQRATDLDTHAAAVDKQADEIEAAWPDQTGQAAASMLRTLARAMRDQATRLRRVEPILRTAAGEIGQTQVTLAGARKTDRENDKIEGDDTGKVGFTDAFHQLPDDQRREQYMHRTNLEHEYFTALYRATRADEDATTALLALQGKPSPFPPRPDTGPVDLSDEAIRDQLANSSQGQVGDCYFLSALAAIANANPQLIRDRIKYDPATGKYTVTVYENALVGVVERQIEVDPEEVKKTNGTKGPNGELNFLSIYEAAYLKTVHGSIFTRTGGAPSAAMLAITGKQADFTVARPSSFEEIRQTLESNPPGAVAVGTSPGVWPWPDDKDIPEEDRVMSRHAYWVKGFDEQGRIILVNPWGPDGGSNNGVDYPGEVHLTEEEFRRYTTQTARTVP